MPISHEVKEKFLDVSATIRRLCFIPKVIAKYTERNIGVEKCILTQTAILIHSRKLVHVASLTYPDLYSERDCFGNNSDSWANLKGSLQIKFRLCYLNIYLKDILDI